MVKSDTASNKSLSSKSKAVVASAAKASLALGKTERIPMSSVSDRTVKLIITGAVILCAAAGGLTAYIGTHNRVTADTISNSQHQLTQISYKGQQGVDALKLLEQYADDVGVKHYSFGDLVTSINGSTGTGPKYWTFYINGKEATMGAGDYKTKDTDQLKWVLW